MHFPFSKWIPIPTWCPKQAQVFDWKRLHIKFFALFLIIFSFLGIKGSVSETEFDLSLIVHEQPKKASIPIEHEDILPDQEEIQEVEELEKSINLNLYVDLNYFLVVVPDEEEASKK